MQPDTAQQIAIMLDKAANLSEPVNNQLIIISLFLGVILHVLVKLKTLYTDKDFVFKEFITNPQEIVGFFISIIFCILIYLSKDSIIKVKYGHAAIGDWIYVAMGFLAYVSDSIVDKLFGGYQKKLQDLKLP